MLQNHPGDSRYPVTSNWLTPFEHLSKRRASAARAALTFGIITIGVAVLGNGLLSEAVEPLPASAFAVVYAIGALGLLLFAVFAWLVSQGATARRREQQRYYELGRVPEFTEEQRSAFQLDAVNAVGLWSETLETWPCAARLGKVASGSAAASFVTLPILPKEEALESLDGDWGVLSAEGCRRTIADLLAGMHSAGFAEVARGPDGDAMLTRLAELTGLPLERVRATLQPANRRPARLIWAWDLARVVPLARKAFMAGLFDEAQAWDAILSASRPAHALFASVEDFYENYRIGHAFWSNDYQGARTRAERIDAFLQSQLPVRRAVWQPLAYEQLTSAERERLAPRPSAAPTPTAGPLH
ncbi:DUF1266 domain-containing protein [Haliangium ochraceum]|uniref:DUF1266 domain-containing protein n=1 Tax=Haliangium ochraceum (strain DSM 14365 / JCM 11303 / SMP-2) TaxID=502025 RepID=D0LG06_HALO1|nr:DUF1266 domain-containing protein [Haliangium ochraceum]ACY14608.1 hypothetical protein Hoch_2063 [Haliangium ochraceum DSM 14365]